MERLTEWNESSETAVCERPAAYEEIKAPFTENTMINLAAQALGVEADRLRELAEADKDGRVVVLPCKVMFPRTTEVADQYRQYCPNCGARMDGATE